MKEKTILVGTKTELLEKLNSFIEEDSVTSHSRKTSKDKVFGIDGIKSQLDTIEQTGFPGIVFYMKSDGPTFSDIENMPEDALAELDKKEIVIQVNGQYVDIKDYLSGYEER